MAQEYFLYTTDFNNTLVDRSDTSFAPLPPNTGEIFIDFFIPVNQPLYYYRESSGTIVINNDQTIEDYLNSTTPPTEEEEELTNTLTGITADIAVVSAATLNKIDRVPGATGNLGTFLANGNLEDSGIALSAITGGSGGNFIEKVTGATENNFAVFTNDGQIQDSGLDLSTITGLTSGTTESIKFQTIKNGDQIISDIQTDITSWNNPEVTDAAFFTFNTVGGILTFQKEGWYDISYNSSIKNTGGGSDRTQAEIFLQENVGGSGFTDVVGSKSEYYIRQNNYGSAGSSNILKFYNQGDQIKLTVQRTAGSDTAQVLADSTILNVVKSEVGLNTRIENNTFLVTGGTIITGTTGLDNDTFTGYTATTQQEIDLLGVSNSFYAFSRTSAGGAQLDGYVVNVARISTGVYDYTFDTPLLNANYGIFAQPFETTTDTNTQISLVSANGFRVSTGIGDNGTSPDILTDTEHTVGVFGVPISGGTNPAVGISDFTGYTATTKVEIDNKINKITTGTTGNVPTITPDGGLGDSGFSIADLTGGTGGGADGVVSGATLGGDAVLSLSRTEGLADVTVDLSPLSGGTTTNDGVVSGATLNGSTLELSRTEGLSDVTVDLAPLTGDSLSISDFNAYSAATDTRIDGVESDISFISGVTDTKLESDVFTGYTASTATKRILLVNNTPQDLNQIVGVLVQWDVANRVDSDVFTSGTTDITILETSKYIVNYSVPLEYAGGGNAVNNVGLNILVNGTANPITFASITVNKDRQQTGALSAVEIELNAGDVIELEGFSLGGNRQAVTIAGSTWIQITKVNI